MWESCSTIVFARLKQQIIIIIIQLAALKLLYAWRDKIAREEDESTRHVYVLPDLLLIHLAELLLKDPQGIRACCKLVPELVEKNLEEIHRLLIQAIEKPLVVLRYLLFITNNVNN
ncbi:unnamed protein product [Rotaria socialis]|uniref:HRDC domain-containing protein n=1 Tax=Rotaria socialis TaxID=392032 RepID=A0A821IX94_9BILA|nr:unnamed protein product [Rotaria socialis]